MRVYRTPSICSAHISIRQHTRSAYVSIRQQAHPLCACKDAVKLHRHVVACHRQLGSAKG
jgi:hypothetical protein